MLSYWEQQSFTRYSHIVVGAGLVGLSTALELRRHFPKDDILVLERGLLPTGATTRNAGFACTGSATEILEDLQTHSEASVVALVERRKLGLAALRSRLPDSALAYSEDGGHEILGENGLYALDRLDYLNALLRPVLGDAAFANAADRVSAFGFDPKHIRGCIRNKGEGAIHSGRTVRALMMLCMSAGIEVKTGAMVDRIGEDEKGVTVILPSPHRRDELHLRAKTVTICTNAFAKNLLPETDVRPGRGQVFVTAPIPGLQLRGVFHYDRGYYYFREIDGRVLFGGGRNLDFEGESTMDIELNETIQSDLEEKLREWLLPAHSEVKIDYRWSGIMAFGPEKSPIVKQFSPRVFGAFRMGGMGVALGSTAAAEIAHVVVDSLTS